jgi:curved DNA-binding protein
MKFQDYYEVLGIARNASQDEVQRAYRKLARKYHPDVSKEKGAEEKFKAVNEAHEVLCDPEKRKRYDTLGANWKAGQDFQPPPGWEQFAHFGAGRERPSGHAATFSFEGAGFSDFFEALFGAGGLHGHAGGFNFGSFGGGDFGEREAEPHPAPGAQADLTLSIEDLYHSGKKLISLQSSDGATRSYQVKIPPGTTEGGVIRLAGQAPGGGDLLLTVHLAAHPRFSARGADLVTHVQVSPWEAALGAKVPVRTVDGEVLVKVPAGGRSGMQLRLKGKGLLRPDATRGDLLAEIQIAVPGKLSPQERELFSELQRVSRFNPRAGESENKGR